MNPERLLKVLLGPHISEKSTIASDSSNQYVFRVLKDATKAEIRQAVELIYQVNVESISTLVQKGKVKRTQRGVGKRRDIKKAYVRLADGQEIDFVGAQA